MTYRKIAIFSIILVAGCVHSSEKEFPQLMFEQLKESASLMDGKRLSISGFLKPGVGGLFLYSSNSDARSENYSTGLDVVIDRNVLGSDFMENGDGKCALVEGLFTAFDDDTVGAGYFRSRVGFVQANRVTVQDCPL